MIVIVVASANVEHIQKQLVGNGHKHREDYFTYDEFLGEILSII